MGLIQIEVDESPDIRFAVGEQALAHGLRGLGERERQRFGHEFVAGTKVLVEAAVSQLQVLHQVRETDAVDTALLESGGGGFHEPRVSIGFTGFRMAHEKCISHRRRQVSIWMLLDIHHIPGYSISGF